VLTSFFISSTVGKKNSLFDIPEGRNLSNIDHLIAQSTDEREIKELKQQKRLLRNRQAASVPSTRFVKTSYRFDTNYR
jgi:hypothetical protein